MGKRLLLLGLLGGCVWSISGSTADAGEFMEETNDPREQNASPYIV